MSPPERRKAPTLGRLPLTAADTNQQDQGHGTRDGMLPADHFPPAARVTDPATSHAAAVEDTAGKVAHRSGLKRSILAMLTEAGPLGMTDDEIAARSPGEDRATVAKRRGDLVKAGLVEATPATRITRRGCDAIVWRAVDGDQVDRPPVLASADMARVGRRFETRIGELLGPAERGGDRRSTRFKSTMNELNGEPSLGPDQRSEFRRMAAHANEPAVIDAAQPVLAEGRES